MPKNAVEGGLCANDGAHADPNRHVWGGSWAEEESPPRPARRLPDVVWQPRDDGAESSRSSTCFPAGPRGRNHSRGPPMGDWNTALKHGLRAVGHLLIALAALFPD